VSAVPPLHRFPDRRDTRLRQALEARGLTHLLVGGKAFHEREEVDALRTALTAIEWPDDALSVFATLRGPFFAVAEEELLAWHALGHGFRPHDVPKDAPPALAAVGDALTTLAELNRLRNARPVAETIGRLLEATRACRFVLWRGGEQVLANVLQIAELARRYEATAGSRSAASWTNCARRQTRPRRRRRFSRKAPTACAS
jgi:ATP-dependent exoDNAse (exonuclease V) beta subunit